MKKAAIWLLVLISFAYLNAEQPAVSKLKKGTVCVFIIGFDESDSLKITGWGSGFIARNGAGNIRIYTARHVVAEGGAFLIGFTDEKTGEVEVKYLAGAVACDPGADVASLEIVKRVGKTDELKPFYDVTPEEIEEYLGDMCLNVELDKKIEIGDNIHAAGYPSNNVVIPIWQYSAGVVSGTYRGFTLVSMSNPFDHGQSGGPVVNDSGTVVGIAYATTSETGKSMNLVIPSTEFKDLWRNEETYASFCGGGGEPVSNKSSSQAITVSGRIINEDGEGIEDEDIYILDYNTDYEEFLSNPNYSLALAHGHTDELGIFECVPQIQYSIDGYHLIVFDRTGKYESGSYLIRPDEETEQYIIKLDEKTSSSAATDYVSDNESSYSYFFTGEIRYNTGSGINAGLIAIFESMEDLGTYLYAVENAQQLSENVLEEVSIGNGIISEGSYIISLKSETVSPVVLLIIDIERNNKLSAVNNLILENGKTIIVPW